MENYQVVLLMSVFVLLGALYVHKVEEKIVKIKDEIFQHGYEIKKGKEGLESTNKALIQVKVELETTIKELTQVKVELESTKKEVKQVQVELESTKNEVKQVKVELESTGNELKQVKVELDTSKEKINKLRSEMIEKDNDRKKEINQIRADVIAVREELNKIKTVLLPKGYDGTLTYNYFDEMAQSYCASQSSGWVFALRRDCARGADTCNNICASAKNAILASISNERTRVSCFDGYHVGKNHNRIRDNPSTAQPDSNTVIFKTYGYGSGGCTWKANHCGPNYCCCKAF